METRKGLPRGKCRALPGERQQELTRPVREDIALETGQGQQRPALQKGGGISPSTGGA